KLGRLAIRPSGNGTAVRKPLAFRGHQLIASGLNSVGKTITLDTPKPQVRIQGGVSSDGNAGRQIGFRKQESRRIRYMNVAVEAELRFTVPLPLKIGRAAEEERVLRRAGLHPD